MEQSTSSFSSGFLTPGATSSPPGQRLESREINTGTPKPETSSVPVDARGHSSTNLLSYSQPPITRFLTILAEAPPTPSLQRVITDYFTPTGANREKKRTGGSSATSYQPISRLETREDFGRPQAHSTPHPSDTTVPHTQRRTGPSVTLSDLRVTIEPSTRCTNERLEPVKGNPGEKNLRTKPCYVRLSPTQLIKPKLTNEAPEPANSDRPQYRAKRRQPPAPKINSCPICYHVFLIDQLLFHASQCQGVPVNGEDGVGASGVRRCGYCGSTMEEDMEEKHIMSCWEKEKIRQEKQSAQE